MSFPSILKWLEDSTPQHPNHVTAESQWDSECFRNNQVNLGLKWPLTHHLFWTRIPSTLTYECMEVASPGRVVRHCHWGGLAAWLWEAGSAGSVQLLAPSESAEPQRATTCKVMPFLVQWAPGWGRGAQAWYHWGSVLIVDGIFGLSCARSCFLLLSSQVLIPKKPSCNPKLHLGISLVVWEGRASTLAMNLVKGCTLRKRRGVSHKMHAFKEGLADRSTGDT